MKSFWEFEKWLEEHHYPEEVLLSPQDFEYLKRRMNVIHIGWSKEGQIINYKGCTIKPHPRIALDRPAKVDVSSMKLFEQE